MSELQYNSLVGRMREGVNGSNKLHAYDYAEGIYVYDAETGTKYWLSEITSAFKRQREIVAP